MNIFNLARQAAAQQNWQVSEAGDDLEIQAAGLPAVRITLGEDGDGDSCGFIWARAASAADVGDPWDQLRENTDFTYCRLAVRGDDLIVLNSLYDADAQLAEVGKTLYYVAQNAQALQQRLAPAAPLPEAPAAAPAVEPPAAEVPVAEAVEEDEKSGGGWLWIIIILIILAGLAAAVLL